MWNSSVVDTAAFTVLYSNASQGQQSATPSNVGEWAMPPLTSDTVFTVMVEVSVEGGQPLTASMTTAVSVRNPALVAASVTAGQASVTGAASVGGPLTASAVSATGLTVNGASSVGNLTSSGTLTVQGQSTLGNVNVSQALTVAGQTTLGGVTAKGVNATSLSSSGNVNAGGTVISNNAQISFGQVVGCNLGDSFSYDNKKMSWYSVGWFSDSWFQWGPTAWFSGYGGIKFFTGGANPAFTIDYSANCRYAGSMAKASSIALKENVRSLTPADASEILAHLDPVEYTLKAAPGQGTQLGFIAEHVHRSVATEDRRAVIPDQIVAVLTRIVKEQQQMISELEKRVGTLEAKDGVSAPPDEERT